MVSMFETLCEQTAGLFINNICEGSSVLVCNMIGAIWDPLTESFWSIMGAGK